MSGKLRESLRESLVVIGSILIAFALDAWWARRVEAADEAEWLVSLAAEFEADRASLEERVEQYRRFGTNLAILEDILGTDVGEVVVADSLLMSLLSAPTYDSSITGLSAFANSGALASLEDEVLRRLLAAWPSYVVDAREDQDAANRVVEARAMPLLSSSLDLGTILAESIPWREGQAVTGVARVTPSLELRNAVAERMFWNGLVISELESLLAVQDSITIRLPSPLPSR